RHGHGHQIVRGRKRTPADRQSDEYLADGRRVERPQHLDSGPRRTRQADLRRARLQHGLRRCSGRGGQGTSRSGEEEVRLSGFDSDAGKGAIAQCVRCGSGCPLRDRAAAPGARRRIKPVMKVRTTMIRWAIVALLGAPGPTAHGLELDREAFTFTAYKLNVQLDRPQHRMAVRGTIQLRNDSATPQKIAVLQISSSLEWRMIKAANKAVQFVRQPYTSDID